MNLGYQITQQLINEADSSIKTIVAIYPGRFQPMGKHHAEAFKYLQNKFGKQHSYVVTSDKVQLPKSPLNFNEKKLIINKHGIKNVVQVKNPYQSLEVLNKYDPKSTAVVFMYGAKDAGRLSTTKKDGSPGYFQDYEKSRHGLKGYETHGYFVIAPHISLDVPGYGEMSGTTMRQALAVADEKIFKSIFGWFDPKIYNILKKKLNEQIVEFLTTIDMSKVLNEVSVAHGSKSDVDDGPRYYYGNQATYRKKTSEMAKRLGYEVINYLVKDEPITIHNTKFPDGPPMSVSYFPTGVKGAAHAGTDYMKDYKGAPAYKFWQKYIKKVATQVGYKFLDFLGAEDSIESSQDEKLVPTTLKENIDIPVNIGDTILMGKFKNKKVVVKSISWNKKGDLLINGRPALKMRLIKQDEPKSLGESVAKQFMMEMQIDEAKANTHLTHLEELILTEGPSGYKKAKSFIIELVKNLKGHSNAKVNTSVKWDGAPAMFVGTHPETKKFFVGTKSVFNKIPKINYTAADVDLNHGHAPGLADKLKKALKYLPSLGIKNILQGDFMFDDSMLKTKNIEGVPHYIFRPNTITYAVEVDSELGNHIGSVKFGIVFHTTYRDLQSGASYGADVSMLRRNPKVWFDDAFFKDATGIVTLTASETKQILTLVKQADQIKIDYDNIPSALLNTYINSEIRIGQFLDDPHKSFKAFKKWVQLKVDKKVEKLKSEKGKARATQTGIDQMTLFDSKSDEIIKIFQVSKLLASAKNIFIEKYNNAVYNTKHFVDDGQGGLKASSPEGYVAVDHIGNGVKLVDRLEFSRANFAMDKGFTK